MTLALFSPKQLLLGVAVLAVFCCPLLAIVEGPAIAAQPSPPETIATPVPSGPVGPATLDQPGAKEDQLSHSVYLHVDNNLVGRVGFFDPSGTFQPARVRISFVQNGRVVNSVRSNEWGRFQAAKLPPGVYSVVANGLSGFAAFSVRILPFDEHAGTNQLTLDVSLIPPTESNLLSADLAQDLADPPGDPPRRPGVGVVGGGGGGGGGFGGAAGGAGGAGGGFGALLGAAGMGLGVAGGVNSTNVRRPPASPFK